MLTPSHTASQKSSSSKSKSKDKSDKKGSSSRSKAKAELKEDSASVSLSNRAGIDGYVHQSFNDGPWSSVGVAGWSG